MKFFSKQKTVLVSLMANATTIFLPKNLRKSQKLMNTEYK